jgi:aromatic ring hydroxylase
MTARRRSRDTSLRQKLEFLTGLPSKAAQEMSAGDKHGIHSAQAEMLLNKVCANLTDANAKRPQQHTVKGVSSHKRARQGNLLQVNTNVVTCDPHSVVEVQLPGQHLRGLVWSSQ